MEEVKVEMFINKLEVVKKIFDTVATRIRPLNFKDVGIPVIYVIASEDVYNKLLECLDKDIKENKNEVYIMGEHIIVKKSKRMKKRSFIVL